MRSRACEGFAECLCELVGAAGGLVSAAYAGKSVCRLLGIHALDELCYAFCVAVSSAYKFYVGHFSVVVDFEVYETRAGSVCRVCEFHSVVSLVYRGVAAPVC